MKNELFNYLKSFMIKCDWNDGNTPEQARAIFTTLCFVGNIDADTSECDNILIELYSEADMENIISYDEFDYFMVEFIV